MSKRQKIGDDSFVETDVCAPFEDETEEIRQLVRRQNRKKKSGGFQSMGLSASVFKGVLRKGYKVPTPVQRKTIPVLLDGKDVVAMARTGSGKTAAFLIPMFEKLKAHSPVGIRALLLSPTRELAIQTQKFTREIGRFTKLKSIVMFGGGRIDDDFTALYESPDILIATPGRLMQILVEMDSASKSVLSHVEYVVFDEADRLFEMGFQEQLHEILHRLPTARQTLLFSATLPKLLLDFAKAGLHNPTLIRLDVDTKLSHDLKLAFLMCRSDNRTALLMHLLKNVVKQDELTVVFVATTHQVEYINMIATELGLSCSYIYSALDQTARVINIEKFRQKRTSLLVATDAVARGIDIPLLDNVINYNFPDKPKLFLHRVGRVARAGRLGSAYSIVCPEEMSYVIDLHLFLGRSMKFAQIGTVSQEDGLCGRIPQPIIDDQGEKLKFLHEKTEIQNIDRAAQNAFKRYCRTRVSPSSESIRRSKEMASLVVGFHPMFGNQGSDLEAKHDAMLEEIRNYKPRETVVSKQRASLPPAPKQPKSASSKYGLKKSQKCETSDSSAKFRQGSLIVEAKALSSIESNSASIWKSDAAAADEVWGGGDDGLSIWNTESSSFDIGSAPREARSGSDKNHLVWSRKKKKFVHENELKRPEKKIKVKKNLYKKWLDKNKMQNNDGDDNEPFRPKRAVYNKQGAERRFRFQKEKAASGAGGTGKVGARDRLKPKEQILKERKVLAQKKSFQAHQIARKNRTKNGSSKGKKR